MVQSSHGFMDYSVLQAVGGILHVQPGHGSKIKQINIFASSIYY